MPLYLYFLGRTVTPLILTAKATLLFLYIKEDWNPYSNISKFVDRVLIENILDFHSSPIIRLYRNSIQINIDVKLPFLRTQFFSA